MNFQLNLVTFYMLTQIHIDILSFLYYFLFFIFIGHYYTLHIQFTTLNIFSQNKG